MTKQQLHKFSLTMIVKNEEAHLPTVLETAHIYADEIIIVDTGSTDRTKEIARKFTDKVLDFAWCDDFSLARNFGVEKCTGDFIIWLDADDIVTREMAEKIKALKYEPIDTDVLYLTYIYARNAVGEATLTQMRERIFRNHKGIFFEFPVHECLKYPPGLTSRNLDDISIIHNKIVTHEPSPQRNLRILTKAVETPAYCDDFRIWSYLAQESEPQKAIAYYEKLFRDLGETATHFQLTEAAVHYGRKLMAVGRHADALDMFGEAILACPLWREPFFYAAQAYFYLQRYPEMLQMLLIAGTIKKPGFEINVIHDNSIYEGDWYDEWLFFAYHYLLDREKAVEVLERVLARFPNSATFQRLKEEKRDWLYPSPL